MTNEGRIIACVVIEDDIVETSFEIYQADKLCPTKKFSISSYICQLVLLFRSSFINRDDILNHPIVLATLSSWDQEYWRHYNWVLISLDWCYNSLSYLFFDICCHPLFLIMTKWHRFTSNRCHIGKMKLVVIFWITDCSNAELGSCQVVFIGE